MIGMLNIVNASGVNSASTPVFTPASGLLSVTSGTPYGQYLATSTSDGYQFNYTVYERAASSSDPWVQVILGTAFGDGTSAVVTVGFDGGPSAFTSSNERYFTLLIDGFGPYSSGIYTVS